jgi:ligand-binding sensor domain-containing protein
VVEGDKKKIFVNYYTNSKMKARIKCVSEPEGANIYLNDSLTNFKTPFIIGNLMPDEYKITYSYSEHRDRSKIISAESNNESLAFLKLQDTSVWLDYTTENSNIPDDFINCLDVDSNNVIWMGTSQDGLVSYSNDVWRTYNTNNSLLPDNFITDIVTDQNSNLWIGTYVGLVYKEGDYFEVIDTSNSVLASNEINVLSIDRYNRLWIGTKQGFYSKDEVGFRRHYSSRNGEPFAYISSISFDTEDNTWVGTYFKGIGRSTPDGWVIYTNNHDDLIGSSGFDYEPLPSNSISASLVEIGGERVWFGHVPNKTGPGGISVYNQKVNKWSFYSVYVPSPIINSFYYGPDKSVWICTDKGLVRWKQSHETYFLNENIKEISIDKDKNLLWVASQGNGLIKYKQK